jgi:hypothetical protein
VEGEAVSAYVGQKYHGYRGLKLWKWLCAHPWSKAGEIAEALGWTMRQTSDSLAILRQNRNVRYEGKSSRGVWCATEIQPRDGRGLSPGSLRNLTCGPQHLPAAAAKLAELRAAGKIKYKKRGPRRQSVLVGKIALEQCWPIAGFSSNALQARVANDNDNKGRRGPKALELPESEEKAA